MEGTGNGDGSVPVVLALPVFAAVLPLGQVLSQPQAVGAKPEQGEGLPGVTPLAGVTNWDVLGCRQPHWGKVGAGAAR